MAARPESLEEAEVGIDQEGQPPFTFIHNEAMTDRAAP
jgi:hypothetical protein